jgi:hypothetical protein
MTLNEAKKGLLDIVDTVPDDLEDLYEKVLTRICNIGLENGLIRNVLRSNVDLEKAGKSLILLNETAEKIITRGKEEKEKKLKMIANDFI